MKYLGVSYRDLMLMPQYYVPVVVEESKREAAEMRKAKAGRKRR